MSELQRIIKNQYSNDWIALSNADKIYQLTNMLSSQKNHYGFKPQGLWLGLGDNWLEYIKDNDMTDWITEYCSAFSIKLGSNFIVLKDEEDYLNFTKRYSKTPFVIKWDVVAKKYDGIIAYAPRRFAFNNRLAWTYGWDVTSACVWKDEGIKDVEEIFNGCNDENFKTFKDGGQIHYTCVLINQNELLNRYGQTHKNLYSHHSTIEYKPKDIKGLKVGKEVELKIVGRLTNDKLDVLLVDNPYSKNKYPHITLSTSEGVKPFESNIEIENNLDDVIPLDGVLKGVITVCRFEQGGEIKIETEDETTTLFLDDIGSITITETTPQYEFVDDISEDELESLDLYEDDFITKIEDLRVNDEYKGKGYAKLLMKKALDYIEENYSYPIYLNASPMLYQQGLNLNDLTGFYESFGFKVFKKQGGNNLMIKQSKDSEDFKKGGNVVTWKHKYNKKYGYPKNESHSLKEISKDTGVSMKGLRQIYNKGIGAYKTNPSSVRPNVTSKEQWAMARVYSSVMGGKASKVDAKELKMEKGGVLLDKFELFDIEDELIKNITSSDLYHGSTDISWFNSLEDIDTFKNTKNAKSKYLFLSPNKETALNYSIDSIGMNNVIKENSGVLSFDLKKSKGKNLTKKELNYKSIEEFEDILDKYKEKGFDYVVIIPDGKNYVILNNEILNFKGSFFTSEFLKKKNQYEQGGILNNPNFKSWFGDSKVVDENGNPLVVYHSTNKDFDEFKAKGMSSAFFFSENKEVDMFPLFGNKEKPHSYNSSIIPVYLKLENPKFLYDLSYDPYFENFEIDSAKKKGNDGVIIERDNQKTYVVFEPTQIKSAIGNNGEYDPNNPSIIMAEGGQICTYDFDGYDLAKKKCGDSVDVFLIPAEYDRVAINLFENHLPLWLYYNYLSRIVISKEDVFTFKKQCLEKFEVTNPVQVLVKPSNDSYWKKTPFGQPRSFMRYVQQKNGSIQSLLVALVQDGFWANKFKERTSGLTLPHPRGVQLNTVIHEFAHVLDVIRFNEKNPSQDIIVTHQRGFIVALIDILIASKRKEIPIVSQVDNKALIIQRALQKPSFVERYKDQYGLNVFDVSIPKDLKEYDERFAYLKGAKLNKQQAKEIFDLVKKYQDEILMNDLALRNPTKANRLYKSTNVIIEELKKYS